MSDRIDAFLDGELAGVELTTAERAQADLIRAAAETLRSSIPPAPADLESAVLTRIRELEVARPMQAGSVASRIAGVLAALWQPRQVTIGFRPAWGVALGLLALLLVGRAAERLLEPPAAVAAAPAVFVQFRLEAEGAHSVSLAGSFTEWQPAHELVETESGVWTVMVPLPPGVHDYAFLVDRERWVADPAAAMVDDGFGGVNSRLALLPAS